MPETGAQNQIPRETTQRSGVCSCRGNAALLVRRWQAYCCRSKMQPSRASGLRRTPQKRNRRPMISQGTPGAAKLTIILLGSISSSPKLYPNQSRTRVARPMVSQGTQSRASMGNSQTVLAFHCVARLFFRDLFPVPRRTNPALGVCYFSWCRRDSSTTMLSERSVAAGSHVPAFQGRVSL